MECENCFSKEAIENQKYCKECKRIIIKRMEKEGYLQKRIIGHSGSNRTKEMKELTYQTKHGTGQ